MNPHEQNHPDPLDGDFEDLAIGGLTDSELDELEALGAAEDAAELLGEIDA